jgi:hypothetical protein
METLKPELRNEPNEVERGSMGEGGRVAKRTQPGWLA